MTQAIAAKSKNSQSTTSGYSAQSIRETVESIIVAFVLAFLFRAFVAEAFVIPTGSMAPTLMGAHKDLVCEHCGQQFQAGASQEIDTDSGLLTGTVLVASVCENCRELNAYDFRGNKNHVTFSGDRILVSKFDYVLGSPERWDVFVFKFPGKARMNYIKRLVGLPGESLLIREGDVFVKSSGGTWAIARKPPNKIRVMRRLVSDTKHVNPKLVESGWPGNWQPWAESGASAAWQQQSSASEWSATLSATENTELLRYFHKVPTLDQWNQIEEGERIETPPPTASQLVTDFLAYNASLEANRSNVYSGNKLKGEITSEARAIEYAQKRWELSNRGIHWVNDFVAAFEVDITSDSGLLVVDLVEHGMRFRAEIDVARGDVTLRSQDAVSSQNPFGEGLKGSCKISGAGSYKLEMANFDDSITLWVNGNVVKFDGSTDYASSQLRTGVDRRPYWTESDPLDAAPIGIGGKQLAMQVTRATVYRDIYYIAPRYAGFYNNNHHYEFSDFSHFSSAQLRASVPDANARATLIDETDIIETVYATPQWWAQSEFFSLRGQREFSLDEKQFFPLGDNSAASLDARSWEGEHYVGEEYLLGKALLVFWPHTWNTPVPFTPNFQRFGRIR